MLYKQYKEKYAQLKDKKDNKLITPEQLIYKKYYDLDLLLLGKEGFNFYSMLISEYKACKC